MKCSTNIYYNLSIPFTFHYILHFITSVHIENLISIMFGVIYILITYFFLTGSGANSMGGWWAPPHGFPFFMLIILLGFHTSPFFHFACQSFSTFSLYLPCCKYRSVLSWSLVFKDRTPMPTRSHPVVAEFERGWLHKVVVLRSCRLCSCIV